MTQSAINPGGTEHRSANGFLAWWRSELLAALPETLLASSEAEENLLLLFTDRPRLLARERNGWRPLGELQHGREQEQIQRLVSTSGIGQPRLLLRLPADAGLKREIELPLAAEQELDQVLAYQLDGLSPYPPEQICYSYRITGRDHDRGKLLLDLYLAPREQIEQALQQLQDWGLTPVRADFVDNDELGPARIDLLPATPKKERQHLISRFNKLLLLLTGLLLAAVAASHLMGKATLERQLMTRLETAKIKADVTRRLQRQADALKQEDAILTTQRERALPALEILNELSRILPDGTWLESAEIQGRELNLSGLSANATALISEIERSPLFEQAAFKASVVQEERLGRERFRIKARLTPGGKNAD